MHDDARRAAAEYDDMGAAYADASTENPYNALYERPAILELAGSVDGLRVLDVGCAAGALSAELARRRAIVTALDASEQMVAAASARLGANATVHRADLASPLDFLETASFDLVTASLVLHYLRDWAAPLSELHRVLVPDGMFAFTVHHPAASFNASPSGNYFATELLTDVWKKNGRSFNVHYYRRSLQSTLEPILASGFTIERIIEPRPLVDMQRQAPTTWAKLSTEPWFRALQRGEPDAHSRRRSVVGYPQTLPDPRSGNQRVLSIGVIQRRGFAAQLFLDVLGRSRRGEPTHGRRIRRAIPGTRVTAAAPVAAAPGPMSPRARSSHGRSRTPRVCGG